MSSPNFYTDTKFCSRCADYVKYLQSINGAYCVTCGAKVKLFSAADRKTFLRSLKKKPKTGTDRKNVS